MNKEKINKYLANALGDCWHDAEPLTTLSFTKKYTPCKKCGWNQLGDRHPDYFTPQGFFKLWIWAKSEEWWPEFLGFLEDRPGYGAKQGKGSILDHVDPERLAPEVFEFHRIRVAEKTNCSQGENGATESGCAPRASVDLVIDEHRIVSEMCYTHRHDYGIEIEDGEKGFCSGMTKRERESLYGDMSQIFYHCFRPVLRRVREDLLAAGIEVIEAGEGGGKQ